MSWNYAASTTKADGSADSLHYRLGDWRRNDRLGHFKASEYILETGKPPPDWLSAPIWRRLQGKAFSSTSEVALLARLDELIRFFEHCSFYEDDFARDEYLSQLERVRQAWQSGKIR